METVEVAGMVQKSGNTVDFDIQFTEITAKGTDVRKKLEIGKDGGIVKRPQGAIYRGSARTVSIKWSEFGDYLDAVALDKHKALALGVTGESEVSITTKKELERLREKNGLGNDEQVLDKDGNLVVSRGLDWFSFPGGGEIGVMLLDLDSGEYGVEDLVEKLSWLGTSAWVKRSSSAIQDSNGNWISGENAYHIYIPIRGMSSELIKLLAKYLWLSGMESHLVLKNGGVDWRTAIDKAVGSPERLIFEADPETGTGLCVSRGNAKLVVFGGVADGVDGVVDGALVEDYLRGEVSENLFDVEWLEYQQRRDVVAESNRAAAQYRSALRKKLTDSGMSVAQARAVADSREKMRLLASDSVTLNSGKEEPVLSILLEPEVWNGKGVCDPIEPEYGTGKAKVYVNEDGSVFINSFAHGGRVFRCLWDYEGLMQWLDGVDASDLDQLNAVEEFWAERSLESSLKSVQVTKVVNKVFELFDSNGRASQHGISRTVLKDELRDVKRDAKEEEKEQIRKETGLDEEATHDDIMRHMIADRFGGEKNLQMFAGRVYSYEDGMWKGYDRKVLQGLFGIGYGKLKLCKRVTDYSGLARYLMESIETVEAWPLVCGIPCMSGFWRIEKDGSVVKEGYGRETWSRWRIPTDPDFKMKTEMWDMVIENAVSADQRRLLQQMLGCLVTGAAVDAQKALLMQGAAGSGKSTILNVISGLFPKKQISMVSLEGLNDAQQVMKLADARLNVVPELSSRKVIPTTGFKTVIGQDLQSGRVLYQGYYYFRVSCGVAIACNYFPKLDEYSEQIRRRLKIVQFDGQVRECDRIEGLDKEILKKEKPGIIAWCLEGAADYMENGWDDGRVEDLYEEWFTSVDPLVAFIKEECRVGSNMEAGAAVLYEKYCEYCENGRGKPVGKQRFRAVLETDFKFKYKIVRHSRKEKARRVFDGVSMRFENY